MYSANSAFSPSNSFLTAARYGASVAKSNRIDAIDWASTVKPWWPTSFRLSSFISYVWFGEFDDCDDTPMPGMSRDTVPVSSNPIGLPGSGCTLVPPYRFM